MSTGFARAPRALLLVVTLATSSALVFGATAPVGAQGSVRGFDGSTITVAGYGVPSLPTVEVAARARFKRFNDTNEIKGIKIEMTEFASDGQDPATALSVARRLVTQTGVFAVVPETSANTPSEYLTQQKVPFFGGGFGVAYCSPKPSTDVWGFSGNGCQTSTEPSFTTDLGHSPYTYISETLGKKHPTLATIANDNDSGKATTRTRGQAMKDAGFDVVSENPIMPTEVSDYTPYVTELMTADNGQPPDAVDCFAVTQCINVWLLMSAQGYEGIFWSGNYHEALVKPSAGAYAIAMYADFTSTGPGITQMRQDLDAFEAGAGDLLDFGDVMGYTSADLFVSVLKKAAAKGTSGITHENVQKIASTIKWSLPGFMKTSYPKATVNTYPVCSSFNLSNGTAWEPVETWSCSKKTYPVKG
jgi:ABC-type branched-subunit amino acid transport system substrate-binding protein